MTREEAHDIIIGFQDGRIDVDNHAFYHALDFVVDLLESPSSNHQGLDEAAEEKYPDPDVKRGTSVFANDEWREVEKLRNAFKNGAKWMAEQLNK